MKTRFTLATGLSLALTLAACGGGGTSGITGNTGLGSTVTTGVSITSLNAPNVAAAVLNGVSAVSGSADGAASVTPLVTGVAVNTGAGNFSLSGLVLDQLARVSALQNAPASGIVGAAASLNLPCANGGTATVAANIQDPQFQVLMVGDTLDVTFFMCNETGILLDGNITISVDSIVGSTTFDGIPPYNVTLTATFNALQALDGSEYYYADGDMTQALADDNAGNVDSILSGTLLDTSYNDHDQKVSAYTFDLHNDGNTGDYTADLDGTVESRDIDGTVTFSTTSQVGLSAFAGNELLGNGDPTSGKMLVQSLFSGLTQLWLTAQNDGINVTIEVDDNGDDIVDSTLTRTWAELSAL